MHTKIEQGWLQCSKCGHSLGKNITFLKIGQIKICRYCKSRYELKSVNDILSNSGTEIFSVSFSANPIVSTTSLNEKDKS